MRNWERLVGIADEGNAASLLDEVWPKAYVCSLLERARTRREM
jgi:hypothetical protein